ncbi:MAG: hypothetical protein KF768_09245 [Phycisphaeraceae bacterium]|nr:hypothetical protein [Phycisphaeraceae bacterium]
MQDRIITIAAALFCLCVLVPSVRGQIPDVEVFTHQTLREAHEEAIRSTRLLIVYVSRPGNCPETKGMDERTWKNRTLEGFVKWHAVTVRVQEGMYPTIDGRLYRPPPKWNAGGEEALRFRPPGVVFFVRGKYHSHLSTVEVDKIGGRPAVERLPMPGGDSGFGGVRTPFYPKPLWVLLEGKLILESLASIDPMWLATHEQQNPEPQPPARDDPWHTVEDVVAPRFGDPGEDEPPSALARLDRAREMVRSGDYYNATGMYTWLWERGAEIDPSFAAARRSVLAQEMRELTRLRPSAAERFRQMRSSIEKRFLWLEFPEVAELFTLSSVLGEETDTLTFLDGAMNDPDEAAMLPASDALAYRLLSLRTDYAAAWELPENPMDRVARICSQVGRVKPRTVGAESWAESQAFARAWAREEGARIFTACLVRGRDDSAMAVAERLLRTLDDGTMRRTLVTTALAANPPQARRVMERWLAEAEAMDGRLPADADLRNRLTLGLAAREHPDAQP